MNVLIISAHDVSLDRRIIAQANALCKRGDEVTLLSIPVFDDFSGILDSRVKKIIPILLKSRSFYFRWLKEFLKKVLPSFLVEKLRSIQRKRKFDSYESYFLRNVPHQSFDVIHAHDLTTLPSAVRIRDSLCPEAKIVYDTHELYPYQYENLEEQRFWHDIEKRFLKDVDQLVIINEGFREHFERTYGACPPMHTLYNSYHNTYDSKENSSQESTLRQDILKEAQWDNHVPIFLFQGNITEERNLKNLVMGFKGLEGRCNLLIVGRGPFKESLEKIKEEENLKNVFFLSWISQDKMPSLLRSIDAGIIPYEHETILNYIYCTPNKLFEFMEFKVPMLACSLPEIKRIVEKYRLGFSYSLKTAEEMNKALQNFLEVKDSLKKESFDEALKEYGWDASEKTLNNLYDSFLLTQPKAE